MSRHERADSFSVYGWKKIQLASNKLGINIRTAYGARVLPVLIDFFVNNNAVKTLPQ